VRATSDQLIAQMAFAQGRLLRLRRRGEWRAGLDAPLRVWRTDEVTLEPHPNDPGAASSEGR
jgi:muconolactone delta-isomerase